MTLVCEHPSRNRNGSVSRFVTFVPNRAMLRLTSSLGGDADVTLEARITGLTATARRFGGIVIGWLGKTAREGGS
jgi:hypothetical protein